MGRWRHDELAGIDAVAVQRAISGPATELSKGERFLAVVELRRQGVSYLAIATRLQIDPRQVYRYLSVAGLTSTRRVHREDWAPRTRAKAQRAAAAMEATS